MRFLFLLSFIANAQGIPGIGSVAPTAAPNVYLHYRIITIDHTQCGSSTSSNFPFVFNLSDTTMKTVSNGGHIQNTVIQSGGRAITIPADLVISSTLSLSSPTLVPWEVESYDGTGGNIWIHFQGSCNNSTNQIYYEIYDAISVTTQQNTGSNSPSHVWDSNFKAVWHLAETNWVTSQTLVDSTSNANGAIIAGTTSSAQPAAQIDGGGTTAGNGASSQAEFGTALVLSAPFTFSFWTKADSSYSNDHAAYSAAAFGNWVSIRNTNQVRIYNGGADDTTLGLSSLTAGTWYLFHVVTNSSGATTVYVDGSLSNGGTGGTFSGTLNIQLLFNLSTGGGSGIAGDVDEYRISNTNRSADWILSEYNNQKSSQTLVTVGSEN